MENQNLTEEARQNLRQDYLPKLKLPLWQRKDMFCMNTDTVLLGEQMVVRKGESVLDLGCNNGALLLYASRFSPGSLTASTCFPKRWPWRRKTCGSTVWKRN